MIRTNRDISLCAEAGKLISPTFASFEFTTWKLSDQDSTLGGFSQGRHPTDDDEHAFDMNVTPEPIGAEAIDEFGDDDRE